MTKLNKLVRDKIPEIMAANNQEGNFRRLSDAEYKTQLDKKLCEELNEYQTSESKQDAVEELADLVEVVYAVLEYEKLSIDEFEKIRLKKKEERGGFRKRLMLSGVED